MFASLPVIVVAKMLLPVNTGANIVPVVTTCVIPVFPNLIWLFAVMIAPSPSAVEFLLTPVIPVFAPIKVQFIPVVPELFVA